MLDSILGFLETIGEYISTAWQFLVDFFKDLGELITLVGETVLKLPDYLSFLPEELLVPLLAVFTVVVLYKILGREG